MTKKPLAPVDQKGDAGDRTAVYQATNPALIKAHKQLCNDLHTLAVGNAEIARDQKAAGDTAGAAESEAIARAAQADAAKYNCSWAQ